VGKNGKKWDKMGKYVGKRGIKWEKMGKGVSQLGLSSVWPLLVAIVFGDHRSVSLITSATH
jgi:hypothetical protein